MSTMYQNKIVSQNSRDSFINGKKGSVSFASNNERFNDKIQTSPGPGSYQAKTTNYKLPQYHLKRDKDNTTLAKRQHQWIWGSDRNSFIDYKSFSSCVGPGSYNIENHQAIAGRTNWNKSDRFYSLKDKKIQSLPGPGAYEHHLTQAGSNFTSVFKSKSPRNFIQKTSSCLSEPQITKSNVRQFMQNPESGTLENQNQNGDLKNKKSQKILKNSVFASKIPRLPEDNIKNLCNLGPGAYGLDTEYKQSNKNKLPKIITVRDQQKLKRIEKPVPLQIPGPGSYDTNLKTIQKQLQTKGTVLIGSQPRFINKLEKIPGPGHYLKEKKTFLSEIEKLQKSRFSPIKPSFNSSSERASLQLISKQNPLCSYNLDYYDMQHKIKKNQDHIQKLKIMEVTLPAFNTKSKK